MLYSGGPDVPVSGIRGNQRLSLNLPLVSIGATLCGCASCDLAVNKGVGIERREESQPHDLEKVALKADAIASVLLPSSLLLAPAPGFEPGTSRLTAAHSTS